MRKFVFERCGIEVGVDEVRVLWVALAMCQEEHQLSYALAPCHRWTRLGGDARLCRRE